MMVKTGLQCRTQDVGDAGVGRHSLGKPRTGSENRPRERCMLQEEKLERLSHPLKEKPQTLDTGLQDLVLTLLDSSLAWPNISLLCPYPFLSG